MRPPPRALRRVLIGPLWLPLGAGLAMVLAVVAVVAGLALPLSRKRRALRVALCGAVYLAIDIWLLAACTALWLRHPWPARRDSARWSQAHERLLMRALSTLLAAARRLLGFTVAVQEPPGPDLAVGRPLLVLARHGGPGDSFALVQLLLSRYHRRPAIVAKETLCWDPGLDVILSRLPSCFIRPGDGAAAARRLTELARGLRASDAILLFPEGGNWTPGRHSRTIDRLRRAGRRQAAAEAESNRNVLPPRAAGVLACLRGRADLGVAVVAHTGLEDLVSAADMWHAVPVHGRPMSIRWWYEQAGTLPETDDERREWLRLQWAIVDSWIDARRASRGEPVPLPADADPNVAEPAVPVVTVEQAEPFTRTAEI